MARIVKDRIKQPSTTTGTGTITLSGSVAGFQAFSVLENGNTTFYCIEDANGIAFEVGIGTYTSNTLARTTILESSNNGNAISLTSGTHTAFVTYPAERAGFNDEGLSPTLTASGTITAGKPVIQNANGTVTQVVETSSPEANPTQARGNITTSSNTTSGCITYEEISGRHVYAYSDTGNSSYNTVVAGVWTNGAMAWGTPIVVASSGAGGSTGPAICAGNGAIYLIYKQGSYAKLYSRAATISGTTFTFGSAIDFSATGTAEHQVADISYDKASGYIMACYPYRPVSGPMNTFVRPLSASGTTLTAGSTEYLMYGGGAGSNRTNLIYDPDTSRTVIIYSDASDGDKGKSRVLQPTGTASSPTLTVGSAVTWASQGSGKNSVIYDTANNKMFVSSFLNEGGTEYWKGCIGTVTGGGTNTISWTAQSIVWQPSGGNSATFASTYDTSVNKGYIWVRENSVMKYNTIAIGTSSFTMGTLANLPDSTDQIVWNCQGAVYNSANGTLLGGHQYSGSTAYSQWVSSFTATTTSSNLTPTNYLGVASNSATTTNPIQINVNGSINNAQTSLTVDKDYYTTSAGNIVTRLNGSGAAQATQFVGTALSATALSLREFPASTIVGKADGTVTKGKPVIVEPDGDVAQVTGSSSSGGVVSPETQQVSASIATEDKFFIANNGSGTIGVISLSNSAGPQFVLGTDNGTSITWGTPVNVNSNSNYRACSVYYDPDEDKFICSIVGQSPIFSVQSRIISYSGTTATLSTESSALSIGSGVTSYVASSAYDTTYNKGYVSIGKEVGKMFTVTVSGTTITQSALSSNFSGTSNSAQFFQMVYDNTNSTGYIVYRNEAQSDYPYLQTYSVSGDTFTFGTETVIETTAAQGYVGVAEGSADGKGVCVAWKNSSNVIRYATPTFSGLTPTIGTVSSLTCLLYTSPSPRD